MIALLTLLTIWAAWAFIAASLSNHDHASDLQLTKARIRFHENGWDTNLLPEVTL